MSEINVVARDEVDVIGLVLHTSFQEERSKDEIPPFFHGVLKKGLLDVVPHRLNNNKMCVFRLKPGSPDFDYMIGVEVSQVGEIPEGMEHLTIPAHDYAMMPFIKRGHADGMQAFARLTQEWLPASNYTMAPSPIFIYYDEEDFFSIYNTQGYDGNPVGKFFLPVSPKK